MRPLFPLALLALAATAANAATPSRSGAPEVKVAPPAAPLLDRVFASGVDNVRGTPVTVYTDREHPVEQGRGGRRYLDLGRAGA